jgi:hypothetical protein
MRATEPPYAPGWKGAVQGEPSAMFLGELRSALR